MLEKTVKNAMEKHLKKGFFEGYFSVKSHLDNLSKKSLHSSNMKDILTHIFALDSHFLTNGVQEFHISSVRYSSALYTPRYRALFLTESRVRSLNKSVFDQREVIVLSCLGRALYYYMLREHYSKVIKPSLQGIKTTDALCQFLGLSSYETTQDISVNSVLSDCRLFLEYLNLESLSRSCHGFYVSLVHAASVGLGNLKTLNSNNMTDYLYDACCSLVSCAMDGKNYTMDGKTVDDSSLGGVVVQDIVHKRGDVLSVFLPGIAPDGLKVRTDGKKIYLTLQQDNDFFPRNMAINLDGRVVEKVLKFEYGRLDIQLRQRVKTLNIL